MSKKTIFSSANILFIILLSLVLFLPAKREIESPNALIFVIVLAELIYLYKYTKNELKSANDVATVTFAFLIVWEIAAKLKLSHPVLVPPPENVFHVFITQYALIIEGLFSSLQLLILGIGAAMILGILGGLLVGYIPRIRQAVLPIASVISPIPPLVYTPYVVAVMPTFKAASIFVIFSAVFWPTFMHMIIRVGSVEKRVLDSARSMKLSTPNMLFQVILPYCMPDVIGRLSTSLTSAMLCLTGAEMLGASSGMGYFVRKFSDFADYTKVIAGIIFIGLVVSVLNSLVKQLEKKVIKWKY
ncbi:MAG: ABC transporter permease subunit [Clostridiales bacterium]|nr:ABC transporter permease subunit [Clostridiales bacterium]